MNLSKWWEDFKDRYYINREDTLEVLFAECRIFLQGAETIRKFKRYGTEYYVVKVGMHSLVFNIMGKYPTFARQSIVDYQLAKWRRKEYKYTRWIDL